MPHTFSDQYDSYSKDLRWWNAEKEHRHEAVTNAVTHTREKDTHRREANLRHMRLYENIIGTSYNSDPYATMYSADKVTLNVIKSVIDTVSARIAKNKPHPKFMTTHGNWTLQRRAKLLEKFVEAKFDEASVYDEAKKVFKDSCVFGTGALKIFRERDKICVERVFPGELFVPRSESLYGQPRCLYQRKWVSKTVLCELYPKHKQAIKRLDHGSVSQVDAGDIFFDADSDQVLVTEAWHLPSGVDSGDGRHSIVVDNATLLDEPYTKDHFPFCFFNWDDKLRGFWGRGIAEQLTGIQIEINRILIKIQKAFNLMAVPRIFVNSASKINKSYFNNKVGTIIPHVGEKPTILTPPIMQAEVYEHLWMLYNRAFEIAGVSTLSATGDIPEGLRANGRAMLVYNDVENERFALVGQAWEQLFMDIAKQFVQHGKEAYEEDKDFSVVAAKDKNTVSEIRWKDVDMEEDQYTLRVYPTSILPQLPAGKMAAVEQLIAAGFVPQEEGAKLLGFPDLDSFLALDTAMSEYADRICEQMLDDHKYEPPEPYMDFQMVFKKVQAAYADAVNRGADEPGLKLMRRYMRQLHAMVKQVQAETQNLQALPAAGAPPAMTGTGVPLTAAQPGEPGPSGAMPTPMPQ